MPRLLTIAVAAVVLVLGTTAVALADDIYVSAVMGDDLLGDGSVVNPYASIGSAMATATAGDDIFVGWGVYNEDVGLISGVDIYGSSLGAGTHLVGTGSGPAIQASGVGTITVDGISVSGGLDEDGGGALVLGSEITFSDVTFSSNVATETGGGLYAESSVLTLTDCVFEDNTATNGGGLGSRGCTLTVTGTTFDRNVGTGFGAGGAYVEVLVDEDVLFDSCSFTENTAGEYGGGLWLLDDETSGSVVVTGTVFTGNHAANDGGGLLIQRSHGVVSRCEFISNTSGDDGGGAASRYGDYVLWSWCTFTDNEADDSGGGLHSRTESATIADCTFTGNTAADNGGGIDLYEHSTEILRCTITGNSANGWEGGGVNVDACCDEVYRFEECTISGNDAPESGGGLFFYADDQDNVLEVIDCTITGNTSYDGGGVGIYIEDEYNDFHFESTTISENTASEDGGGLYFDNDGYDYIYFWITECTISGNAAGEDGGGLEMYGYDCCDELYVTDSVITSNTAGSMGGGARLQEWGEIIVDGCTVVGNEAFEGGGLWLDYADVFGETLITGNVALDSGGGVYLDSNSDIWDSTISGNSAVYGGGIYMDNYTEVWDSTISGNTATYGGGLYGYGGHLDMDDSRVAENTAMQGGGFYLDRPDTRINGVTFFGNHADEGGASYNTTETPGDVYSIVNSIFDSNEASTTGSALFTNGAPYFVNNTVVKNRVTDSPWSGALWAETGPGPDVANCIFYDNIWDMELLFGQQTINTLSDWWGGGPGSFSGDPEFRDFDGGDYRLLPTSPCIDSGASTPTVGVGAPADDHEDRSRPQDGDGNTVALWDMGAFEQPVQTAPMSMDDTFTVAEDTLLWPAAPGVLGNDFDINGEVLTASFATTPANGGFGMSSNGRFVFTPDPDWNGTTTFTYRSHDGVAYSAPATVTIIVTPVNDPPVSTEDTATCAEDGTATVDVLANDSDVADMDSLTATLTTPSSNGTVTLDASGAATYTPDPDWHGTDMFWYQAYDGTDYGDVTTVTITVTPVNDAPVAVDDAWTTEEDTWFWAPDAGVLVNDFDIDSPAASLTVDIGTISPPTNAGWNMNPNGSSLGYLPQPADWNGTFTATYRIFDGALYSESATITITVTPVNDAPRSSEDATGCAEDAFATVDVLANDIEVDGDSMTVALVTPPSNGSVMLDPSGAATYTPDADWFGTDYFYYQASDDATESATGAVTTVTVTVTPVNDAPVADEDAYTTAEDTTLTVTLPGPPAVLLDNDTDVEGHDLDVVEFGNPANGTITGMDTHGQFTYTPDLDWYGTDVFSYRARESTTSGLLYSNWTTVTITVTPVNDAPDSSEDATGCAEDTFATIDVLANDSDVENEPLVTSLVGGPSNGSVALDASGDATYTPNADWFGTDYFWYQASDGTTVGAVTTVTVTVTPVNDAPVAVDDSYVTDEDVLLSVTLPGPPSGVIDNDSDVESDTVWWYPQAMPTNGTLIPMTPFGEFTYQPDPDWYGTDTFTYRLQETSTFETHWSNVATVTITVNPVNDAPVSVEDTYTVEEDGMLIVPAPGVIQNDYDVEDDPLTAQLTGDAVNGTLVFAETGALVYVPDADWYGTEYCYYRVYDGDLWSMESTIAIEVTPVQDAPVSEDDTATCAEDGMAVFDVLANDTDADPLDVLTAQVWSDPDHGTVELDASGIATYTPDADWFGNDTFVYRTFDGTEYSALALVSITVTPVNDAPVAMGDHYETTESTTLTVDAPGVLENDYDIDSPTLTASITVPPGSGVVTSTQDGSFDFLPDDGFWGTDHFVYVTSDGATTSAPATVTIDVLDVTPPVTTSDATWDYFGWACVSFTATDTASGVATTWYSLDGAAAVAGDTACTDVLGQHTLSFWSVDNAGNVEDPTTVEFELEAALTDYESIAGSNRYATAAAASFRSYPATVTHVVIATGMNWPDALGGAALAGVKGAPILLSRTDSLPGETRAEITRLGATEAYILGGVGALSNDVRDELVGMGLTVRRLAGSDRYGTSRAIAHEVVTELGAAFTGRAFLSTGLNFADAMGAGPAAAEMGWPIYLTRPDDITDTALQHMVDHDIDKVVMLGGPGALAGDVENRLDTAFGEADVKRLAGTDRYETAVKVAEWTVSKTALIWDGVAFATGEVFPDALAAGPMQAEIGSVLLLTGSRSLDPELETFLIGKREIIDEVRFLGGDAAITPSVRARIAAALR